MNEPNPTGKDIRFIDSRYKELFRIPDGGYIQIHYPDGTVVKPCKFINEHHMQVGDSVYHICEFAEIMEHVGAIYMAEPEIMGDEAAWKVGQNRILAVQTCDDGYHYTLLDENYNDIDAGQVENLDLTMIEVRRAILESLHLEQKELRAMVYEDVMKQKFSSITATECMTECSQTQNHEHITLNDFISELIKLQKKHGEEEILSIGTTNGMVGGLLNPYCIHLVDGVIECVPSFRETVALHANLVKGADISLNNQIQSASGCNNTIPDAIKDHEEHIVPMLDLDEDIELNYTEVDSNGNPIRETLYSVKSVWLQNYFGVDNQCQLEAFLTNSEEWDPAEILNDARKEPSLSGLVVGDVTEFSQNNDPADLAPYRIKITESYVKELVIYEKTSGGAEELADQLYAEGEISIDADNFADCSIECLGIARQSDLGCHDVFGLDEPVSSVPKPSLANVISSAEQIAHATGTKTKQIEPTR